MEKQPQWQPLSMLPVFTEMVNGMLASSEEQLANMRLAAEKPHVIDEGMLERITALYTKQLDDHWLFEEQYARWRHEDLTVSEEKEVERLIQQSSKLRVVTEEILHLASSIAGSTIEKILAMDEAELALKVLSGELDFR